ncbi:SUKH-4 family immunity protein [Rossellomorea marisflavi]|uniref:SUKH-4 family immunity protein n=1 Tax=Rossellomorea marisflavi TaxID=189381 RepID=UPI00064F3C71|nr:SUKH-4 family immunity protein [Rossellomorea marisflavi]KML32046.1 hypothetical protein VL12_17215 [Rossellomorea marisflavi]
MISPQDFLEDWNQDIYGLIKYEEKVINSFPLSHGTKEFLIEAGFPESAPPFLTFESVANGGGVRVTKNNEKLGSMYNEFLYFGFTGSGYPICINETNSELVCIDYDDENKLVFINTTVTRFAESLLVYVEFIKKVKAVNGRRAYLEKNATKDLVKWISGALQKIDANSLTKGAFWEQELSSFED